MCYGELLLLSSDDHSIWLFVASAPEHSGTFLVLFVVGSSSALGTGLYFIELWILKQLEAIISLSKRANRFAKSMDGSAASELVSPELYA